jgi:hypothetical protein
MNKVQDIFDFQVITLFPEDEFSLPKKERKFSLRRKKKKNPIDTNYFDHEISKTNNYKDEEDKKKKQKYMNIDYWIGITSNAIEKNYFFSPKYKKDNNDSKNNSISGKNTAVITSEQWERDFSPPSLFEYITISVLTCSLYFLSSDFNGNLEAHKTKGCIFDYTRYKPERKILVSSPGLCSRCKQEIHSIETQIHAQTTHLVSLSQQIEKVLSRGWMGSPEQRETPFYNLRRIYKYDIDRNSGFYKDWKEKFRESVSDKLAEWTVGNIVGGIVGGIIVVIFVAIFGIKP